MQGVTIKKESGVELESSIKEFLNPKFIFLPIKKGFKLKVEDEEYVYKNDIVAMSGDGKKMYSCVSGRALGIKNMTYYNEEIIPSLVIENDFKENTRVKKSARRYISDYSDREIVELLNDMSLSYKGSFIVDKFKGVSDTLVINGVEIEPYFANKFFTIKGNVEILLETADVIGSILKSNRIYLVIRSIDSELISEITNVLGTYPNIELKLIADQYPNGIDEVQQKRLGIKNAVSFDVQEILEIYHALKRERPIQEMLITVAGSGIKPNAVIKVKVGTLLSEIFINKFDFTSEKVDVYLNGMIHGELVDSLKYVVDSNIDGIFVTEKSSKVEEACMSCGLCSKHCPAGLNPKYVFDHEGKVKPKYYDKCLRCGLCNYMCPASRDLRKYMKGGK